MIRLFSTLHNQPDRIGVCFIVSILVLLFLGSNISKSLVVSLFEINPFQFYLLTIPCHFNSFPFPRLLSKTNASILFVCPWTEHLELPSNSSCRL